MKTRQTRWGVAWAFVAWLSITVGFSADGKEEPWTPLFNGKDLTGWVGVHDVLFAVVEGNLRLVKGMGWLRTEKTYQDFVLEFECRALEPKYDSGIFIRAGLEGQPWPKDGWQVNLRYDALGGLVKGTKSVVPAENEELPVNQWFKVRIEVKGKRVVLHVNGEKSWESQALDAERGYVGIQVENNSFDFRNIRIQELATGPAN